ncbi:hypothetical protein PMAYCL1PPCAC_01502, partial [Pristionchus mayeri]
MNEERDLWRKFEDSVNLAGQNAAKIEGSIGQRLSLIRKMVFELGNYLYASYDCAWQERPFGDSFIAQQICAIESCEELKKSLYFLVHIQRRMRARQESIRNRKLKVTHKGSGVSAVPAMPLKSHKPPEFMENPAGLAEASATSLPLFDNGTPIKEEPIEIKEELINDHTEIKQGEPIPDVFCPSTGDFRPIDSSTFDSGPRFHKIRI